MDQERITETMFFGQDGDREQANVIGHQSVKEVGSLPPPIGQFKTWEEPLVTKDPKEYPSHQAICLDISLTKEQSPSFRCQPYFVPVDPPPNSCAVNRTEQDSSRKSAGIRSRQIHVVR